MRFVPEVHWRLAGGANHRFVFNIESELRPGAAEIARRPFRRPCRGSPHFVAGAGGLHHRLISATPPAFVIDAVPKLRKLGTFVTVLACTKRLAPTARHHWQPGATPQGFIHLKSEALKARFVAAIT